MGEMYDKFIEFLSNSNIKDRVEAKFIDVFMEDLDEYKFVVNALNKGISLPLTAINGTLRFYGGISNQMVFDEIKKLA